MINFGSLRQRIFVSYLMLAVLICTVFMSIFIVSERYVENEMMYAGMAQKLDQRIDEVEQSSSVTEMPGMSFYIERNFPEDFQPLTPRAEPYEIGVDGNEIVVIVRQKSGARYAIAANFPRFEKIEFSVSVALILAAITSILVALLFAMSVRHRVISPLNKLAMAVSGDTLSEIDLSKLDVELRILAQAIISMESNLNAYLSRERVFTGDVSHELRTPLAIILGSAELLAIRFADNPEAMGCVERIRRVAQETSHRVAALLLLSRAPENLTISEACLAPIVAEEIASHQYVLDKKPVECHVDLDPDVRQAIQPELAGIAFGNLIRNAFHFTSEGEIVISLDEHGFCISDTGVGIPEPIDPHMFERFVTVGDPELAGSGLGLSIVKRVCKQAGWSLRYEPGEREGAAFFIQFDGSG